MAFETTATIHSFGGKLLKLKHNAKSTNCTMAVNLFLPPQADSQVVPVLFYLSGLTCTPENCSEKGFFHAAASKKGIAMVYPDTSPRGLGIEGEDESWDFGTGAGFYVDATEEPWSQGYNMYTYIVEELPKALFTSFQQLDSNRVSITGHSMGGHGALTLYLRNPDKYKSVSALAPVTNPTSTSWGQKAFKGYLGESNRESWNKYDASELVKNFTGPLDILIDQGTGDSFYMEKHLQPETFAETAKQSGHSDQKITVRLQPKYDHSYFFISTFAEDHVEHAAKYLFP